MGIKGLENLQPENHDETDVPAALERSTQDGSGFVAFGETELPEGDYEGEDE